MTNPYNQPGEYVSTKTNWFNPNGVAHYTLPVSQPTVEEATNSMVNAAIANKQRREAAAEAAAQAEAQAEAEAKAKAEAEAEAAARDQAEAEAEAKAKAEARANFEAEAAAAAAAAATRAQQDQEIRLLLDEILRRPTHPTTYSQAFYSVPNVLRDVPGQGTTVGQRMIQEQTTRPPLGPAPEPTPETVGEEPCCGFDHCDGFCRFIQNP